jgi:hypothetical protein
MKSSLGKRSLVGAIALGAAMIVLPGCGVSEDEEIQEGQTNATTEDVAEVDADDAVEEGEMSLIGQMVTVRSEIQDYIGDSSFTLEEGGGSILVINASGVPFETPAEDVPVQATGEVVEFVFADVEGEFSLDLIEDDYVDYEGQPAIIAESLALAPSAEDLTENPDAYRDQVIALQGDARDILSPDAFALFEQGWVDDIGILVVGVQENLKGGGSALQEDESVTVTGRIRDFDGEALSQEYDLGLTPDQISEFNERYDRPVVIAEEVYPSAVEK